MKERMENPTVRKITKPSIFPSVVHAQSKSLDSMSLLETRLFTMHVSSVQHALDPLQMDT